MQTERFDGFDTLLVGSIPPKRAEFILDLPSESLRSVLSELLVQPTNNFTEAG